MPEKMEENRNEDSRFEQETASIERQPRPRRPEYANRIQGRSSYMAFDENDE